MSLITRCPACATMFKVVPDQLRVSDGWVRCGQCDEVFDATLHMQPGMPMVATPTPTRKNVWGELIPEGVHDAAGTVSSEVAADDGMGKAPDAEPVPDAPPPVAEEVPAELGA